MLGGWDLGSGGSAPRGGAGGQRAAGSGNPRGRETRQKGKGKLGCMRSLPSTAQRRNGAMALVNGQYKGEGGPRLMQNTSLTMQQRAKTGQPVNGCDNALRSGLRDVSGARASSCP